MRGVPRGRAARSSLRARLAVARRGSEVLERKLDALAGEQRRLDQHRRETQRAWEEAMAEASRWYRRAVVIGGSQQVELARSQLRAPAEVAVKWRSTMGATYPARVDVRDADVEGLAAVGRSGALVAAAEAHRRALVAALDHAAAVRASDVVDAELAVTRRRLRALDHRWVPELTDRLQQVELALDEEEREDMVRVRWTAGRDDGRRP
jgi:V/A-type H+-transporting ATPase subunit D